LGFDPIKPSGEAKVASGNARCKNACGRVGFPSPAKLGLVTFVCIVFYRVNFTNLYFFNKSTDLSIIKL
jgi:hypothetical protein